MKLRILSLLLVSMFSPLAAFAETDYYISPPQTAPNLSRVPGLLKNERGLSHFREEMSGIRSVDYLGTNLPKGLTSQDIIRLLAPHENANLAMVVGSKAFPYRLNTYVAIACFAPNPEAYKQNTSFERTCEKKTYHRDDTVYLGLIEYTPLEAKPKLLAKPIQLETNWYFLDTSEFRARQRGSSDVLPHGKYKEFDFAPFKVNDTQTAFGLRVGWNDSYSGGIGYFETLTLFMVDGDRLINIFAEPIYFYQNLAGAWNKDGTREHIVYEGENILAVLPSQTEGYYDLQLKSLDREWQRILVWDSFQKRYVPANTWQSLKQQTRSCSVCKGNALCFRLLLNLEQKLCKLTLSTP